MQSSSQSAQSQDPVSTVFPAAVQQATKNEAMIQLLPPLFESLLSQAFAVIERQGFKNEAQLSKALRHKEEQKALLEKEEQRKRRASKLKQDLSKLKEQKAEKDAQVAREKLDQE